MAPLGSPESLGTKPSIGSFPDDDDEGQVSNAFRLVWAWSRHLKERVSYSRPDIPLRIVFERKLIPPAPQVWNRAEQFLEYDAEQHEIEVELGFEDPSNPPVPGCNL